MMFRFQTINKFASCILLFWAFWWSIVCSTDSVDLFQTLKGVPKEWAFDSDNFKLVLQTLGTYHWNFHPLALFLYIAIIIISLIVAVLFWRAFYLFTLSDGEDINAAYIAFFASSAFVGFFILVDELFIQYTFGHGHVVRLSFILITFLTFHSLNMTKKY